MIKNERQYKITKYQAEKFAETIAELDKMAELGQRDSVHPLIRKAERDALQSQLTDLQRELKEYEELKAGKVPSVFELDSIEELPSTLIKARIAVNLSQKQLGELIGVPEQVIQRYEATDYESASVGRIKEIIGALKITVGKHLNLPDDKISLNEFLKRMSEVGLDRKFVIDRLLPSSLAARFEKQDIASDLLGYQAAAYVGRVFNWTPNEIFTTQPLTMNEDQIAGVRFKVSKRANLSKVKAYTVYARYISLLISQATAHLPRKALPTNPYRVHNEILTKYHSITLQNLVRYIWGYGVPVIALDPISFDAACFRNNDQNIIILTQKTSSEAKWMFNLMHEFCHASRNEEIIELEEELRSSDEERIASQFADIVLMGKDPHQLATRCLDNAKWDEYLLKSTVQKVASEEGVRIDVLANYLAYRLSSEGKANWWGTAENLQKPIQNAREIIRNFMLEYIDFSKLDEPDLELLRQSLNSRQEVAING